MREWNISHLFNATANTEGLKMAKSRRKFVQALVCWKGGIRPSAPTTWRSVTAMQAGLSLN